MTPIEAITRRESRLDEIIDRVENGGEMTNADWRRMDLLNRLDLMSVEQGATREILESENVADGLLPNGEAIENDD